MKHTLPTPLTIDCSGLSQKRTQILHDRLKRCFTKIELWEDEIVAGNPFSKGHYESAWRILDNYGLKVTY